MADNLKYSKHKEIKGKQSYNRYDNYDANEILQAKLGLSTLGVTAAFASYVLSLVATLMLAGHWSDHIGRRAALILAVLAGLSGGWVFSEAQTLAALCAGRALQGAAVAGRTCRRRADWRPTSARDRPMA